MPVKKMVRDNFDANFISYALIIFIICRSFVACGKLTGRISKEDDFLLTT